MHSQHSSFSPLCQFAHRLCEGRADQNDRRCAFFFHEVLRVTERTAAYGASINNRVARVYDKIAARVDGLDKEKANCGNFIV